MIPADAGLSDARMPRASADLPPSTLIIKCIRPLPFDGRSIFPATPRGPDGLIRTPVGDHAGSFYFKEKNVPVIMEEKGENDSPSFLMPFPGGKGPGISHKMEEGIKNP